MNPPKKNPTLTTLTFIFILCFISATLLAFVAALLKPRQEQAKSDYLVRQLLLSARILNYDGTFLLNGKPAIYQDGQLIPTDHPPHATYEQIQAIYTTRVTPMLCDEKGEIFTFEEKGLNYIHYFDTHRKEGFSHLPNKLFYRITANNNPDQIYGITLPISGFGLWDAIYGLITLEGNANTILGFTVYGQQETPGLGGEISEPWWQKQFQGKQVFKDNLQGKVEFQVAPLGIDVVKPGKLEMMNARQRKTSVDGITGATITSEGIMSAIRDSLVPYRNLLIKQHDTYTHD